MKYFFIFSGARFYTNYLLITNWDSKVALIRMIWGNKKRTIRISAADRLKMARNCFCIHFIFGVLTFWIDNYTIGAVNLLVNIYPVIVQLYYGHRCYKIVQHNKFKQP